MKGRGMNGMGLLHSMLWRKRKNYVLLFTSIFLSTFLAVGMVLLLSCGIASVNEQHRIRYGAQDMILFHVRDLVDWDALREKGLIDEAGYSYLHAYTMPDGKSIRDGFALAHYDEKGLEFACRKLKEGRLPQKAGEIAVEATALRKAGFHDAKVGDTLSLTLCFGKDDGEFLPVVQVREYTLVGILRDQRKYLDQWGQAEALFRDFPAAVVTADDVIAPGASLIQNAMVLSNRTSDLAIEIYQDPELRGEIRCEYTDNAYITDNEMRPLLIPFLGIGAMLLLVCGFAIVAAYTTTVEERTKQLGLLRAIGATGRQIRQMLWGQTAVMTAAAIPAGMLLAFAAVYGITHFLGEDFLFRADGWTVLASVGFTFLCVGISSWIPLHKASRISPMQAIRDVEMQHAMRKAHMRSAKHFSVALHMAKRSLRLHKGQWIGVVALTVLAVLIVGIGLPYTGYVIKTADEQEVSFDYQLSIPGLETGRWDINAEYPYKGYRESIMQNLRSVFAGNRLVYSRTVRVLMQLDEVTDYARLSFAHDYTGYAIHPMASDGSGIEYHEDVGNRYRDVMNFYGFTKPVVSSNLVMVSDASLLEGAQILEGEVDPQKLASGEEVIVYAPFWAYRIHEDGHGVTSREASSMEDLMNDRYGESFDAFMENDMVHAGDVIDLSFITSPDKVETDENGFRILTSDYTRKDRQVRVGAVVSRLNWGLSWTNAELLSVITLDSALDVWGWEKPEYHTICVQLAQTPDQETQEYYDVLLTEIEELTDQSHFYNDIEYNAERRAGHRQTLILGTGVVLLFFACTAAMINRILSAQIRNSRRTIGMLRAVGAEKGTVARMFNLQALSVIILGCLLSFAGAFAFYFWNADHFPMPFMIPVGIGASLMYTAALAAVSMLHIRGRLEQINQNSVTENIREL